MALGEGCDNEFIFIVAGDTLDVGKSGEFVHERLVESVDADGFKVVRHACGAIYDADFFRGRVGLGRVVNDMADFGESGGLEACFSGDGFERRLNDQTVLVSVQEGSNVECGCAHGFCFLFDDLVS